MPGIPAGTSLACSLLRLTPPMTCGVGDPGVGMTARVAVAPPRGRVTSGRLASVALPQQVQRALVEPEVVDRTGDLAVLDEVHPVAGQPRQQQSGGIDGADVPQRGQQ